MTNINAAFTERSAGHLMVEQLIHEGVERVYSVPGESFLDILDGLYDAPITNVVARHEGGAGFMALAEARLTGRPGVVMVTRGPGAANAMIAIHTAYQDQTPLVMFVGLIPIADRNRESFQEFDPHAWFGSTAKKVLVLDDPDSAGELVSDAMRTAAGGRPGPVIIGVPEDVLTVPTDAPALDPRPLPAPAISADALAGVRTAIAEAERPMVVVGGDGWHDGCGADLAAWCAAHGVPVTSDFRAYDAIPASSPAWVGSLGYGRSDALAADVDAADLLVFIGAVRSDVLSDGYTRGLQARTIVIDPDPGLLGHTGRVDLHIQASPAAIVPALTAEAPDASGAEAAPAATASGAEARRTRLERMRSEHEAFSTACPANHPAAGAAGAHAGVDLHALMREFDRQVDGQAVVTYGAGNHALWPPRFIRHEQPSSLVAPRNGAMGVGIPAAVAAGLVHPDRTVISVAGDGCFMMNGQEIATAVGYGAKMVVVVIDNGIFATIVEHQERQYPQRPSGTHLTNPDFAMMAQSYGLHGETVRTSDDIAGAVERALASPTGALLHVITDPALRGPSGEVPAAADSNGAHA